MGMTMAEKIIACAAGVDTVHAGDIQTVTLDMQFFSFCLFSLFGNSCLNIIDLVKKPLSISP